MKPNMQERDLYEYAVIRYVPRVEREEFLNIGVILYCRKQRFLEIRYALDTDRILAFCKDADLEILSRAMEAFDEICAGTTPSSPIASLEPVERFRWLTAKRSSILQVSAVHPGLCLDAGRTLEKMHQDLVMS